MIKKIEQEDFLVCVDVIKKSFLTVAKDLNLTNQNAPRFTAFATNLERLQWQHQNENRKMFGYWKNNKIVGYYSLLFSENNECELNNLCVIPEYRHQGIGKELLEHAFVQTTQRGCTHINIGIIEENCILRSWYESFGFVHIGTKKFDFFPFTCGYMQKHLLNN